MKNYIKPSANVIELAVKETLSRTAIGNRERIYKIKIGEETEVTRGVETNIYTSASVSKIRWSDDPEA